MNKERMQEKLRASCLVNPENGCWQWAGQVSNSGHGRVTYRDQNEGVNRKVSAETASYIAFVEDVAEGQMVRQKCSNRLCINPAHLELVSFP